MIIEKLDLNDAIYASLEAEAVERGVTLEEVKRWVISDHARYIAGPPVLRSIPTAFPTPPEESEGQKVLKLSGMFMKAMINRGDIKCQGCTLPLNLDDNENGKCSNCGAEI